MQNDNLAERSASKASLEKALFEEQKKPLSSLPPRQHNSISRSMMAVSAIATNTFRETVRDRILYAIVVFALLATLSGLLFGSLSVDQDVRVLEDLGLFTITIFGGLISVFVGTNIVFKEIDRRTIFLIVTKPINRWEFVTGKFLGLAMCTFVTNFAMGVFLLGVVAFQTGNFNASLPMLYSLSLIYVELLLVIAMAIFFSTFATPLMSMVFTLSLWVTAHLGSSLLALGKLSTSALVQFTSSLIYYCMPDLATLTLMRGDILDGRYPNLSFLGYILAYVVAYCALLLTCSTLITERKEFN